ncbi:alpha/beta fold hydrolase, partial [Actinophytocola sp.]|uniref:alpha/beta fold hydrolase n=1 Tax=Actinophytocola sp. TaxID=1872138 RepID=UPI003899A38F
MFVVGALAWGAASACEAADDEDQDTGRKPPAATAVHWGACPEQAQGEQARDSRQRCATVKVPLNYQDPNGSTIDVVISRIATAKKDKRRGVLLLNPGGPALMGIDMPSQVAPTLPSSVLDQYDLVGFDPRGVGHSTPQSCGLRDPNPLGLFPYPGVDGSIDDNVAFARSIADECAASPSAKNLKYFTTANTARDLDKIRVALGEDKISYWGQSYGTYLGAVYSALFRDRTDRVVLEGNVDPTKVWSEQFPLWGKGMADRFPDAAKVAAAQDDTLGLGKTPEEVTRTYLDLVDRLDRQPVPVPGTQASLTGKLVRNITYGLLLHNETLPVLAQLWKAAADLAGGTLTQADDAVLAQAAAHSDTPGVPVDNQSTMSAVLTCGDASFPKNVDDYRTDTAADRRAWPLTAGMPANIWPCAFWKDKPIENPVRVTSDGPHNILILQNRRDNATPWEGGVGLKKA